MGWKQIRFSVVIFVLLFHLRPLANLAVMSTLTAHCRWEDETARERTCHPPSYAVAKKMKTLKLHTHWPWLPQG